MPRINRVDIGGQIYHVLNRANARMQIFDNDKDYQLFESILVKDKIIKKFKLESTARRKGRPKKAPDPFYSRMFKISISTFLITLSTLQNTVFEWKI